MVYRDEENELLRVTGGWVNEDTDLAEFRVEQSHRLIVGVLLGGQLVAIEQRRTPAGLGSELCTMSHHPLQGFQHGTVRIRLADIHSHALLYEGYFEIGIGPLRIAPKQTA